MQSHNAVPGFCLRHGLLFPDIAVLGNACTWWNENKRTEIYNSRIFCQKNFDLISRSSHTSEWPITQISSLETLLPGTQTSHFESTLIFKSESVIRSLAILPSVEHSKWYWWIGQTEAIVIFRLGVATFHFDSMQTLKIWFCWNVLDDTIESLDFRCEIAFLMLRSWMFFCIR